MSGHVFDTYAAALQHDRVDLPPGTLRIGVVRRPLPWLWAVIDENLSALGPPDPLLNDLQHRQENLLQCGIDEVTAHNRAMVDVQYPLRYRRHITRSVDAAAALDRIRSHLQTGTDVALVCYENTDEKRCHRTLLRELLLE